MIYNVEHECIKDESEYFHGTTIHDWIDEWSFKQYRTDMYTHKIHRYPAMFIPQVIRKLILEYSVEHDNILDIFSGSGTTLVECILTNRNGYGIELNPLANMISRVKTYKYDIDLLYLYFDFVLNMYTKHHIFDEINFKNIEFWYSSQSITALSKLIWIIKQIDDIKVQEFYLIVVSDLLREVSYCNHSGFKMHRDSKKLSIEINNDILIEKFRLKAIASINAVCKLQKVVSDDSSSISIIEGDSRVIQPILPESIDLIITSPPYGDSRTTVAYGQFSRLSMQWLNLNPILGNELNLDNYLLGGKKHQLSDYEDLIARSNTLESVYNNFMYKMTYEDIDQKKYVDRLRDILSFYYDLDLAIYNASIYLKKQKYFILVTGSRIVKNIKLHTDIIISELAQKYGFELKSIMYRNIESKRIPSKVSATNIKGELSSTMTKESIIILKLNK